MERTTADTAVDNLGEDQEPTEREASMVIEKYYHLFNDATHIEDTPKEPDDTVLDLLELTTNAHMLALMNQFMCEDRPLRFSELEEMLDISPKTLSQRLKELVVSGLLTRELYDEMPPRVEYTPTMKAYDLHPAFQFLYAWAERYEVESI